MKKAHILFIVLVLTFLVPTVARAQIDESGNGFPLASPISINSPSNSTYDSHTIALNVTVRVMLSTTTITLSYSVDGKDNVTIPLTSVADTYGFGFVSTISGLTTLPELPDGLHNITVYAKYNYNNQGAPHIATDNAAVYFIVNDKNPPVLSVLSIKNKIYDQNNLPLKFTADKPTSWIGYSIDEATNVTVTGNTTLTGLSSGPHNITIYANDTVGNMGATETMYFSVAKEQEPEPFLTTLVVASVILVAVIGVDLVIYFRKRNSSG
jgi:hypothetical protein